MKSDEQTHFGIDGVSRNASLVGLNTSLSPVRNRLEIEYEQQHLDLNTRYNNKFSQSKDFNYNLQSEKQKKNAFQCSWQHTSYISGNFCVHFIVRKHLHQSYLEQSNF